jgi:hypothetical protein
MSRYDKKYSLLHVVHTVPWIHTASHGMDTGGCVHWSKRKDDGGVKVTTGRGQGNVDPYLHSTHFFMA